MVGVGMLKVQADVSGAWNGAMEGSDGSSMAVKVRD